MFRDIIGVSNKIRMKKNTPLNMLKEHFQQNPKRKMVERCNISTTSTHIYDRSLY